MQTLCSHIAVMFSKTWCGTRQNFLLKHILWHTLLTANKQLVDRKTVRSRLQNRVQQRVRAPPQEIATSVSERVGDVKLFWFEFFILHAKSFLLVENEPETYNRHFLIDGDV